MKPLPRAAFSAIAFGLIAAAVFGRFDRGVAAQNAGAIPAFEVDPAWPRPLPNGWKVGPVSGISVGPDDHVWIVQRHDHESVKAAGGVSAPPVIEFDPAGNVVRAWGGPGAGYDWPKQVHGVTADSKGRVWVSGNSTGDDFIVAFTNAGKFVRQIGRAGKGSGSNDTENVGHATQMRLDRDASELFVSDGENQNHRVVVFNDETGAYRRHWGAYGARPDDAAAKGEKLDPNGPPPKQFAVVHCLKLSRDGLVYVCDRANNRFQVFRKDGTFVKELFLEKQTGGVGSVWDIEFSVPDQRYLYVADGTNQKISIVSRDDMRVVGSIGSAGKAAGQFATSLHDIAVDSKGNLYTGEASTGGRVQKFALKR